MTDKHHSLTEDTIKDASRNEVSVTKTWGKAIIATLIVQTAGAIWWASGINEQVATNQEEIKALREGASVVLTRQQLDDILGSRDERLDNIDESIKRIEVKLDKAINK